MATDVTRALRGKEGVIVVDMPSHVIKMKMKYTMFQVQPWGGQKNWTQSDLRFCENKGSKRFKINDERGQLDRQLRRKLIQNA